MGRASAGAGFLRGLVEHGGIDRLVALTSEREAFDDFRDLASKLDRTGRPIVWARPLDRQDVAIRRDRLPAGTGNGKRGMEPPVRQRTRLQPLRCDPHLLLERDRERPGAVSHRADEPWDALICTSTAGRSAVERILEHHADYLARRTGARSGAAPGGRLQHRVAPAPADRRWHAPEPAGAGFVGDFRSDRALAGLLGAPEAGLGAETDDASS